MTPLKYVRANSALRLRAVLDFVDRGEQRKAGEEWLFEGSDTYIPRKEVVIEEQIDATVIGPNQAIKLCAKKDMTDRLEQRRVAGEQWLVKKPGAYLPLAYESVLAVENAYVLSDKKALHLRALKTFTDDFAQIRNNGDEWLITREHTEAHLLNVYEQLVKVVEITVVSSRQYCVVLNPVSGRRSIVSASKFGRDASLADGRSQLGKKKLVMGEKSFFLQAGEQLEKGIQDVYILDDDEGLVLKCIEPFEDELDHTTHTPGQKERDLSSIFCKS